MECFSPISPTSPIPWPSSLAPHQRSHLLLRG